MYSSRGCASWGTTAHTRVSQPGLSPNDVHEVSYKLNNFPSPLIALSFIVVCIRVSCVRLIHIPNLHLSSTSTRTKPPTHLHRLVQALRTDHPKPPTSTNSKYGASRTIRLHLGADAMHALEFDNRHPHCARRPKQRLHVDARKLLHLQGSQSCRSRCHPTNLLTMRVDGCTEPHHARGQLQPNGRSGGLARG